MIETDNVWHYRTFESVMSDLRNMWSEGMQELENEQMTVQMVMKTTMRWTVLR